MDPRPGGQPLLGGAARACAKACASPVDGLEFQVLGLRVLGVGLRVRVQGLELRIWSVWCRVRS